MHWSKSVEPFLWVMGRDLFGAYLYPAGVGNVHRGTQAEGRTDIVRAIMKTPAGKSYRYLRPCGTSSFDENFGSPLACPPQPAAGWASLC